MATNTADGIVDVTAEGEEWSAAVGTECCIREHK